MWSWWTLCSGQRSLIDPQLDSTSWPSRIASGSLKTDWLTSNERICLAEIWISMFQSWTDSFGLTLKLGRRRFSYSYLGYSYLSYWHQFQQILDLFTSTGEICIPCEFHKGLASSSIWGSLSLPEWHCVFYLSDIRSLQSLIYISSSLQVSRFRCSLYRLQ